MKSAIYDSISKLKQELLPQITEARIREKKAKAREEEKSIKLTILMLKANATTDEIREETGLYEVKIKELRKRLKH